MLSSYTPLAAVGAEASVAGLAILLLTIGLNFYLIAIIPKGFFPQQDTGAIAGSVQGPQDASFPVMDNSIRATGECDQGRPGGGTT